MIVRFAIFFGFVLRSGSGFLGHRNVIVPFKQRQEIIKDLGQRNTVARLMRPSMVIGKNNSPKQKWWSLFRQADAPILDKTVERSLFEQEEEERKSSVRAFAGKLLRNMFEKNEYDPLDSIVRIYCQSAPPNYCLPWQRLQQESSTASGFIIDEKTIITNAHAVESPLFIQVRRHGQNQRFQARVMAMGHECDLALLTVDNEAFWTDSQPLPLGALPDLEDEVRVVGYPLGGDGISVTAGVVSRIEMTTYEQAKAELLSIQIDAAINGGNSGGPVFSEDGEVVGLAFQSLASEDVENMGFVIPASVVRHFLESVRRFGYYPGVCALGVNMQNLENPSIRSYLGLPEGVTGVRITGVNPVSPAYSVVQKDDVLVSIDGIKVANDGTIPAAFGERVLLRSYFSELFVGDAVELKILRDRKFMNVKVSVGIPSQKVPVHFKDDLPEYLVIGGLVFIVCSQRYIENQEFYGGVTGETKLIYEYVYGKKETDDDELVVLTNVLADEINVGYEELNNMHLTKFNNMEVKNLRHLHDMVQACQEEHMKFEFYPNMVVVMDTEKVFEATPRIIAANLIPSSGYLIDEEKSE
mmetsp:Transcript_10841/g.14090  ORF Transcript_10841/g.14090 Transcript_10841/m.14090 type:complete len:583 (-) Transcript_10841:193-1941(-)